MQNEGTLWLVFFISFPHGGEVGKRLTAAQSQGRAFQHELGWGDLQRHDAASIRRTVEGIFLFLEKASEKEGLRNILPSGRRVAALECTGSSLIFLPPLLKVNRGKEDGDDANREKSAWIGALHATHVVGNGDGVSALVWPQNMCCCMPYIWHVAV